MGCDIHVQVDWDEYNDGHWSSVIWSGTIHLGRHYRMFGALVKGHSRWPDDDLAPPERGRAGNDIKERYGPDGKLGDHTYSWVTLPELDAAIFRAEAEYPDSWLTDYRAVAEFMRTLEKDGPTRMVFGFDS